MKLSSALAFASLLSLAACNDSVANAAGTVQASPAVSDDVRITHEIQQRIAEKGELSEAARKIEVNTENGFVTLRGKVASVVERGIVETIATTVAGVTRVDNRLEVKPG
ncbi:MAG: BON domain-containing protein [Planctomycetota bacterium]